MICHFFLTRLLKSIMALMNRKNIKRTNFKCMISNKDHKAANMTFSVTLILNGKDPASNSSSRKNLSLASIKNTALFPQYKLKSHS
jgi:hypothetical protein